MAKATVDRPGRDAYWRGSQAHAGVAQLVRVPACHAGGRGFEPRHSRHSLSVQTEWRPRLGIASQSEILMIGAAPQPRQRPSSIQRRSGFSGRSEEHTSELKSLMRISYAAFCLNKKNTYRSKQKT